MKHEAAAEKPAEAAEKAPEAAKSPITVKPPSSKEAAASPQPSFGSFSTAIPGQEGAVVVTVPSSN